MIHHHRFYQEPETPCIPTEQDRPADIPQQVPSSPIQVPPSREESNMSIGDPIIPPPAWFDETPPPPSISHEDILPPAPSFDETPSLKTAQAPETPTIPSMAKRRSGTLNLENLVNNNLVSLLFSFPSLLETMLFCLCERQCSRLCERQCCPVSARDNILLASARGSVCLSSVRGIVVLCAISPFCLFLGWLMHASHMLSYRICSRYLERKCCKVGIIP